MTCSHSGTSPILPPGAHHGTLPHHGPLLLLPELVPAELFPAVRPVREEGGSHVVPLGGDRVLIAASAPRTAELLQNLGFTPVVVDISEFEKLEGCVTCLSVLLPGR